ncbi:MAG: DUF2807 domain-containing protein, partial [Pedobacter sp.]|nr:DUF2807 domain-containing protein [Chitinophagaceae bacterium]
GSWDVQIAYGTSNTIQIEADDNLLPYIKTEVEKGTLKIDTKKYINLQSHKKITVYVLVTTLTGISLAGSGDIIGKGNFTNNGKTSFSLAGSGNIKIDFKTIETVGISIAGSGNVKLSGVAENVTASIAGSGNASCENVIADDLSASIAGSGHVKCTANKSVKASIMGSGNVYYKGNATNIKKTIIGSGNIVKI